MAADRDDAAERDSEDRYRSRARARVSSQAARTGRWQKALLLVAALVFAAGVTWQLLASRAGTRTDSAGDAVPPGSAGFVRSAESGDGATETTATRPTLADRAAPWLTRVGGSFAVAFVVGWLFRAFVKLATMIAALAVLALLALSYFNVINIDLSQAERHYESAVAWAGDQGQRLGKALAEHLPSSLAGFAGLFVGFRRR
jgi:uncharacterized membrane protein (Fun14 family)